MTVPSSINANAIGLTLIGETGVNVGNLTDLMNMTDTTMLYEANGSIFGGDDYITATLSNVVGTTSGGSFFTYDTANNNPTNEFDVTLSAFATGTTNWTGTDGRDIIIGSQLADVISAGKDNDVVVSYKGNDVVHGDDGHDRLFGGNGHDQLYGDQGNDHIYGEADNDKLFGGDGNDEIDGGSGINQATGGTGADTFDANAADSGTTTVLDYNAAEGDKLNLIGYASDFSTFTEVQVGADLQVTFGNNTVVVLNSTAGSVNIVHTVLSDLVPLVTYTDASENISGTDSADNIDARGGDDVINSDKGNDVVNAGAGVDTVNTGDGHDIAFGGSGNDVFSLGTGNDTGKGNDGHDTIYGEAGNDKLFGAQGNDKLYGGDGDDRINGGTGTNILSGGAGINTFTVLGNDGAHNTITDFGSTGNLMSFVGKDNDTVSYVQDGANVDVTYGTDQTTLLNVDISHLVFDPSHDTLMFV